jgi:hypothetical protein
MPEDRILTAVDEDRDHGYTNLTFSTYEPPAAQYDSRGIFLGWSDDPYREWDERCKRAVLRVIRAKVPAYPGWCVDARGADRLVKINNCDLMGDDFWYVVNLRTHELNDKIIVHSCGEICERYGLPRDRLDMAAFELAMLRHSRLRFRGRVIPG